MSSPKPSWAKIWTAQSSTKPGSRGCSIYIWNLRPTKPHPDLVSQLRHLTQPAPIDLYCDSGTAWVETRTGQGARRIPGYRSRGETLRELSQNRRMRDEYDGGVCVCR